MTSQTGGDGAQRHAVATHAAVDTDRRERDRLSDLLELGLLNTRPEERFDRITRLATELLGMPIALMSLMEGDREWFKSARGLDLQSIPRNLSVCDYAITQDAPLFVEDARADPRFSQLPYVAEAPHICSYAGMPLHGPHGKPIGTICVLDYKPRVFGARDQVLLQELVDWIEHEFELDRRIAAHDRHVARLMDRDPSLPVATRTIALERLDDVLMSRARNGQDSAVVHLDIVNLGHYEQTYGEQVTSQTVANWLAALQSDPADFCYLTRLSDTEFVGAVPGMADMEPIRERCEHQVEYANKQVSSGQAQVAFRVVGGMALHGEHGRHASELVARARQAHHRAGIARGVVLFSETINRQLLRDRHIRRLFETALHEGGIHFHWQPLFSNRGDLLAGFELLARWHDPELGDIYPDEFIPVAEAEHNLSRALVEYALDTAACQIAQWRRDGSTAPLPYVAVNIPGREFYESDFYDCVAAVLEKHDIDGGRLVFELTERSLIADFEVAARTMSHLKTLGIRIAMDDFGTGYSSIAYLTRLPLSIVKLDKSVVQRLEHDAVARELVRGIVDLAHGQELGVVAEGVETRAQHEWVRSFGCEYSQGYLLACPESLTLAGQRVANRPAEL
ncbi:putative diguanylate cyclase/phosphodiesterase (GGDEF and EAL domains) [Salinisphaera sp. T5B8]|uniref:putative bifunctional diguanylate cyclase/phosphodiesterase n=1 Tax=Salinisphaera sp. T5B8 TaxID=1304154 RepID=UPI003341A550